MKKNCQVLIIIILAMCLAGCLYNKKYITKKFNEFSVNDDSTISVLSYVIPNRGPRYYLKLGYIEDNKLKILNENEYQYYHIRSPKNLLLFQDIERMYLFNLPPRKYYILSATPKYQNNIQKPGVPGSSSSGPTVTIKLDKILGIDSAIFSEKNYMEFPLEIQKRKFNILGVYKIKKEFFSTKGTLKYISDMDYQKENEFKNKIINENCEWNVIFSSTEDNNNN